MHELERRLYNRPDRRLNALRDALAATGQEVAVLTHGVDVAHWRRTDHAPPWMQKLRRDSVFWG
jgi:hypothetical protein